VKGPEQIHLRNRVYTVLENVMKEENLLKTCQKLWQNIRSKHLNDECC
jgi:hypothetical protein